MSLASVGALLNIFVIVAIATDPLKILHKGPWVTILNLAFADLVSCISAFGLWGYEALIDELNELYFTIFDFFWIFGVSASYLLLTFLTGQILVITKYPINGRHWLTIPKIASISVVVWLFAGFLGISNTAWRHFNYEVSMKIYIAQIFILNLTVVVQGIWSIKIAVEVKRSGRRSTGNAHTNVHSRIAITVIILSVIFFFTAFPYFLLNQLQFLARLQYVWENEAGQIFFAIAYCYRPIAILNFGANPILYSLRLADYRKSLLALIGKITRKTARQTAF